MDSVVRLELVLWTLRQMTDDATQEPLIEVHPDALKRLQGLVDAVVIEGQALQGAYVVLSRGVPEHTDEFFVSTPPPPFETPETPETPEEQKARETRQARRREWRKKHEYTGKRPGPPRRPIEELSAKSRAQRLRRDNKRRERELKENTDEQT